MACHTGCAIATRAVHAGPDPDPVTGSIVPAVHQNTTYALDRVGCDRGYTYSRQANPTVSALERALGDLEGAPPAVCHATGLAALTSTLISLTSAGDHVVVGDVVYGGTRRLLDRILSRFGVTHSVVDAADSDAVAAALRANTRVVLVESPGNPTLKLCDIAALARLTRDSVATLVVDNTFLTPVLQDPLGLGTGVVIHSTTKYIEGHNSTVGGAVVTRDEALLEQLRETRGTLGSIQAPWEAALTLRGIRTLPLRMARHSATALTVAEALETHPRVQRVRHPFLESFEQRDLALRQQSDGGGVLTIEVAGGLAAASRVAERLNLCHLAENLGATETLVTHPASMTHASVDPEARRAAGITDGLLRVSVGLEDPSDIIDDLEQALEGGAA